MYDLNRVLSAQRRDYAAALREIRSGRKRSHWIWYIFPQVAGLGMSSTSQFYAISGLDEARAYLNEPTLRAHLLEISGALLALEESDPTAGRSEAALEHDALRCRRAGRAGVFRRARQILRRAARHAHAADPRTVRRHCHGKPD